MATATIRILVAVDFDPPSLCALDHAMAWALRTRCELHLLHVVDPGAAAGLLAHTFVELARVAGARLRILSAEPWFVARAVTFERHVAQGRPESAIVAAAERLAADLIMVGAGRVTPAVRRAASCPVLSVASGEAPAVTVRRVVCHVTRSLASRCAAFTAARLARLHGAELVLLHALPDSGGVDEVEGRLAGWRADLELAGDLEVRTALARGGAAIDVVGRLSTAAGELLVVAATERGGDAAGVAEAMVTEARCPVVTVPPPESSRAVERDVRFGPGTALLVVDALDPRGEDDRDGAARLVRPVNVLVRRAIADGALVVYREDGEPPPGLKVYGPVLRGDAPDEVARFLRDRHVARVVLVGIPGDTPLVSAIAEQARRVGCAAELA